MRQRRSVSASEAVLAVSRLVTAAIDATDVRAVHRTLTREARSLFGASAVALLAVPGDARAWMLAADPELPQRPVPLQAAGALRDLHLTTATTADGGRASDLGRALGLAFEPGSALVLPMRSRATNDHVLVLLAEGPAAFAPAQVDVASAFADAAAAALAQLRVAEERAGRVVQLSALTRAAKTLNESLDLEQVLARICREAQSIIGGDQAIVYLGSAVDGLEAVAGSGFLDDLGGYRLAPGEGLAGRVVQAERAMLTNEYQRIARPPPDSPFARVHAALAVPMHWDGELRGVLSVGFMRPYVVAGPDLDLLQTFAELASIACHNASAAAGLEQAARTDSLTGCLNHAALQDGLRREMERCARSDQPLSLLLFDLDDFKEVNERHGHLVGDEVLRRVGHALRGGVRPYDLVARYGGDEFAVVAADADETAAAEIADRALARIAQALADVGEGDLTVRATAGIAQWAEGESPAGVVERADRALLWGKQEGARGGFVPATSVPAHFRPGRFRRDDTWPAPEPSQRGGAGIAPDERADRLQKRTRQLLFANALGARLTAMTDVDEVLNATVDELQRAFGYFMCSIMRVRPDGRVELAAGRGEASVALEERGWSQRRDEGLLGRCLRERRAVLVNDVRSDPDHVAAPETAETLSELCAPLWVGDELWGVVNVEELETDAFDEDDARLLQTVADQVGSALRSALLYERLERAYLGTAEALAAALEAKDAYTARHAASIADSAEAVGRHLGLDDEQLRTLRFGAIFHDIGKISVPEAILNKRGPLTEAEWEVVKQHTIVGEQILAPIEFLADVRPLVRHEHERWDGKGYPDGLAGEEIPLGARIILVCDAFGAMTSDRPYRPRMSERDAREELRRCAYAQFDGAVVDAFTAVLDGAGASTRA